MLLIAVLIIFLAGVTSMLYNSFLYAKTDFSKGNIYAEIRMEKAKIGILYSGFIIIFSVILGAFLYAYEEGKPGPINKRIISIEETLVVEVRDRYRNSNYHCEIKGNGSEEIFVFFTNKKDDAKSFCSGLVLGNSYELTFEDKGSIKYVLDTLLQDFNRY